MEKQVILNAKHLELTLKRLCHELIESHNDFSDTVLVGLQPRGIHVVSQLKKQLEIILGKEIICGNLDITFFRDDFRRREKPLIPSITNIDFSLENKKVVLVFSRWGKVASAATTTQLINDFNLDEIIFTGVAGAIHPSLNIGDIVIGKNLFQHDLNASPFYKRFEIPIIKKLFNNFINNSYFFLFF